MSELALRLRTAFGQDVDRREHRARSGVTPARIMAPRVIFAATAIMLALFGLLMIYSSSSIVGLTSVEYHHDPTYFVVHQAQFAGAGLLIAVLLSRFDYHRISGKLLTLGWGATMVLLAVVFTSFAGHEEYGANRWIGIGGMRLQPSEFAKVTIILIGANICEQYFGEGKLEREEAAKYALLGVVAPLGLIFFQPDKGTTGILVLTLIVMCYLSGVPGRYIFYAIASIFGVLFVVALLDGYSRARIFTLRDPFADPLKDGYQLVQGIYAFGSGGLTGVGLGLSRQKYNYLPMAYNDFIFAIVGEELGLVGTLGMLAAFGLLLWAGLKIAENAPDLLGRLIAAGCTSLMAIQLLLNVAGVVNLIPLSGKPIPFVSYGGSSVLSCFMLVGLVLSVSFRSELPQTSYERRRDDLRLATSEADVDGSRAGEATLRSSRYASAARREATRSASGLHVVRGRD